MSSPARSCSLITTAIASWNFSRKRTSSMHVSNGRPHMLTSNQRGRGNEPVIVDGSILSAVAVNIATIILVAASRTVRDVTRRHARAVQGLAHHGAMRVGSTAAGLKCPRIIDLLIDPA